MICEKQCYGVVEGRGSSLVVEGRGSSLVVEGRGSSLVVEGSSSLAVEGSSSLVVEGNSSLAAVRRLRISVASVVVEHSDTWTSHVAARGL